MYKPFETSGARRLDDRDASRATHVVVRRGQKPDFYQVEKPAAFWSAVGELETPEDWAWTIAEVAGPAPLVVADVAFRFDTDGDSFVAEQLEDTLEHTNKDAFSAFMTVLLNGFERAIAEVLTMPGEAEREWISVLSRSELIEDDGIVLSRIRFQWPLVRAPPDAIERIQAAALANFRNPNLVGMFPIAPLDALEKCIFFPTESVSMAGLCSTHPLILHGPVMEPVLLISESNSGDELRYDHVPNGKWVDRHVALRMERGTTGWADFLPPAEHSNGPVLDELRFVLSTKYGPGDSRGIRAATRSASRTSSHSEPGSRGSSRSHSSSSHRSDSRSSHHSTRSDSRSSSHSHRSDSRSSSHGSGIDRSVHAMENVQDRRHELNATPLSRPNSAFGSIRLMANQQMQDLTAASKTKKPAARATAAPVAPTAANLSTRRDEIPRAPRPLSATASRGSSRSASPEDGYSISQSRASGGSAHTISTTNPLMEIPDWRLRMEQPDLNNLPDPSQCLKFMEWIDHRTRVKDDEDFHTIAQAVWHLTLGSSLGVKTLKAFASRNRGTRSEESIEALYNSKLMENSGKTARTLAFFARADSPTEYKRWHDGWVDEAYEIAMSGTHMDIALAFYRTNWLEIICSGDEKPIWYKFSNHALQRATGMEVGNLFDQFVVSSEQKLYYTSQSVRAADEALERDGTPLDANVERDRTWVAGFNKVVTAMKSHGTARNVIAKSSNMFYRHNFDSFANADFGLKACQNCVIVCGPKEAHTRDGRPEDFITKRMGASYPHEYTLETPAVVALLFFFRMLFVDPDLIAYMRRDFASYLHSGNPEKFFRCFIGPLSWNGKSTLCNFIMNVFGQYGVPLTTSMYSGREAGAESAMPQLTSTKDTALCIMTESREGELLSGSTIKAHTGNETVPYRGLFKDMGRMLLSFKLILQSNFYPQLANGGAAMVGRAVFVPFGSVFADDAPEDLEEQFRLRKFKNDMQFNTKLEGWRSAFLWLMVHDYKDYKARGLTVFPKVMEEARHDYWVKENLYGVFFSHCIEKRDDPATGAPNRACVVTWTEMNKQFRAWIKATMPSVPIPEKAQSLQYLVRLMGKPLIEKKVETWYGWELVPMDV